MNLTEPQVFSAASLAPSSLASSSVGTFGRSVNREVEGANPLCSFKLVAIKLVQPGEEHLKKHYADLAGKGFFNG